MGKGNHAECSDWPCLAGQSGDVLVRLDGREIGGGKEKIEKGGGTGGSDRIGIIGQQPWNIPGLFNSWIGKQRYRSNIILYDQREIL